MFTKYRSLVKQLIANIQSGTSKVSRLKEITTLKNWSKYRHVNIYLPQHNSVPQSSSFSTIKYVSLCSSLLSFRVAHLLSKHYLSTLNAWSWISSTKAFNWLFRLVPCHSCRIIRVLGAFAYWTTVNDVKASSLYSGG